MIFTKKIMPYFYGGRRRSMATNEVLNLIYQGVLTLLVAVVGYFLRRTMTEHDALKRDVNEMKTTYATKDELKELNAKIDKISDDVDTVKLNYITKDDFFRQMAGATSMLERIDDKLERMRKND